MSWPPEPDELERFREGLKKLGAIAGAAGYDSMLISGPDGTTLAQGPLDDVTVSGPGFKGS